MRGLSSRSRRQAFPGPIQRGIPNRSVYCLGMTGNRWGISRLKYAAKQPGLPGRSGDTEKRKKEKAMAYRYKKYEQSETVKKAREELEKQEGTKPGAYASRWQGWLDDTIGKILNREEFSYDMNADALYNQYRDWYVREGKLAMQDTMGQAAALTGGYGSSYARQVGQQTYGSYLTALNDKLPELYRLALSRYQQAGSELNDRYQLLRQQEQDDYGRHQDLVSAWQADRTYLADRYDREQSRDYDRYTGDRTLDYNVWLAAAKRAQSQVEDLLAAGVRPSDGLLAQADLTKEYADGLLSARAAQSGTVSRSTGGTRKKGKTLEEQYRKKKEAGASQQELDGFLKSKIGTRVAGQYISERVATDVRDKRW